jgi:hypothetical protein
MPAQRSLLAIRCGIVRARLPESGLATPSATSLGVLGPPAALVRSEATEPKERRASSEEEVREAARLDEIHEGRRGPR